MLYTTRNAKQMSEADFNVKIALRSFDMQAQNSIFCCFRGDSSLFERGFFFCILKLKVNFTFIFSFCSGFCTFRPLLYLSDVNQLSIGCGSFIQHNADISV